MGEPTEGICADCGLCCTGALYDEVAVLPEEDAALRAAGIPVLEIDQRVFFQLPCAMAVGTKCSIYAQRPGKCRAFKCEVLKRFDEGEIQRSEAVTLIAKAKDLLEDARSGLAPGETIADARHKWRRSLVAAQAGEPAGREARNRGFMMKMTLLNLFLDKHFRKASKHLMNRPG